MLRYWSRGLHEYGTVFTAFRKTFNLGRYICNLRYWYTYMHIYRYTSTYKYIYFEKQRAQSQGRAHLRRGEAAAGRRDARPLQSWLGERLSSVSLRGLTTYGGVPRTFQSVRHDRENTVKEQVQLGRQTDGRTD